MERHQSHTLNITLRVVALIDGLVFLAAAMLNWGLHIPLGFITLRFAPAIWQAGIGEFVVAVALLVAAASTRRLLSWIAFWLSVAGIVVGLSSHQVQGAARAVHVVLIPLAIIFLVLLLAQRRKRNAPLSPHPSLT